MVGVYLPVGRGDHLPADGEHAHCAGPRGWTTIGRRDAADRGDRRRRHPRKATIAAFSPFSPTSTP